MILSIITFLIIIGLIANLVEWIKEHKEGIIGALLILLALAVWPITLIILEFYGLYFLVMKILSHGYLNWAARVGIEMQALAPGRQRIWKWCENKKYTECPKEGYVLSSRFRKLVVENVNQQRIVTRDRFQACCMQAAPAFQAHYTSLVLNYLQCKHLLLPIQDAGQGTLYLSSQLEGDCKRLFELEGAVTEDEFTAVCKSALSKVQIYVDSGIIARTILKYLVSQGVAHKVNLPDLNEDLYVANHANAKSKLVRREITL